MEGEILTEESSLNHHHETTNRLYTYKRRKQQIEK